jgi:tRNA 2-selenouridine synthase
VIDVRSPAEYRRGPPARRHQPAGAVGCGARGGGHDLQAREPFRARKIGAALVARNVAAHLDGTACGDGRAAGGRSSIAGGAAAVGRSRPSSRGRLAGRAVEGGYRSFRRAVVRALYDDPFPSPVVLLDGNTGTAKTAILARLKTRGVQVIDLEGLARHRGSLLGGMGGQPSRRPSRRRWRWRWPRSTRAGRW